MAIIAGCYSTCFWLLWYTFLVVTVLFYGTFGTRSWLLQYLFLVVTPFLFWLLQYLYLVDLYVTVVEFLFVMLVLVSSCFGIRFWLLWYSFLKHLLLLRSSFFVVMILMVFVSGCFSTTGSWKVVLVSIFYSTCFWLLQWYSFLVDTVRVYGCYSTSYWLLQY
jgi:hypothetical protein